MMLIATWLMALQLTAAADYVQALQQALKFREQGRPAEAGAALEELARNAAVPAAIAARVRNALGLVRRDQGRWDDAVSEYKKALDLIPSDSTDCALRPTVTGNLGEAKLQQGRFREARILFQNSLELAGKCPSQSSVFASLQLLNLAALARMEGDYKLAHKLAEPAYAELRQFLGDNHPHTLLALNNLAQIYAAQGKQREATETMERVAEISLDVHGEGNPLYSRALSNLAVAYFSQRRNAEAEPLFRKAIAIQEARYGERHPAVARDLSNLAAVLESTGRADEAEKLLVRSIELGRSIGRPHPGALASLGALELQRGRVEEASAWFNEVSEMVRRGAVGPDPDLARRLDQFAAAVRGLRRSADAERYQIEATRLRTKALIHIEELRKMNYSDLWKGFAR